MSLEAHELENIRRDATNPFRDIRIPNETVVTLVTEVEELEEAYWESFQEAADWKSRAEDLEHQMATSRIAVPEFRGAEREG